MAGVFHQSWMFFKLSGNEKMKVRRKKHQGYTLELDELLDRHN
ncbi:hypothetical protein LINGRAHAP2_LOCUS20521 [Linum grandiflorum]